MVNKYVIFFVFTFFKNQMQYEKPKPSLYSTKARYIIGKNTHVCDCISLLCSSWSTFFEKIEGLPAMMEV